MFICFQDFLYPWITIAVQLLFSKLFALQYHFVMHVHTQTQVTAIYMADLACAPVANVQYLYWWREFEPWQHFEGDKLKLYGKICAELTTPAKYEKRKMHWIQRVSNFFDNIQLKN